LVVAVFPLLLFPVTTKDIAVCFEEPLGQVIDSYYGVAYHPLIEKCITCSLLTGSSSKASKIFFSLTKIFNASLICDNFTSCCFEEGRLPSFLIFIPKTRSAM
jgi:hypothetical protein